MEPTLQTLTALFLTFVLSGVGVGTFFGKLVAWLLAEDHDEWGDVGGILGGIIGLGLYLGFGVGMVTS